ncbi:MAG: hypothetical protein ACK47B_12260 [Armatimonadota bacterium]
MKPKPFNYTEAVAGVTRDLVATLDEFRHVDLDRVLIAANQARQASKHGVYASLVPLRFAGGSPETVVRGRRYRMPPFQHEQREILYLLYVMLPRFHEEQDYHGRLATLIHELYHISPRFDGDIRRFPGKNFAHGHSREVYHAAMCRLADRYLATSPRAHSHEFLRVPFKELLAHPGGVVARTVTKPRAVLIQEKPR